MKILSLPLLNVMLTVSRLSMLFTKFRSFVKRFPVFVEGDDHIFSVTIVKVRHSLELFLVYFYGHDNADLLKYERTDSKPCHPSRILCQSLLLVRFLSQTSPPASKNPRSCKSSRIEAAAVGVSTQLGLTLPPNCRRCKSSGELFPPI